MRVFKFRVWDQSDKANPVMRLLDPADGWSSKWLVEDVNTKVMQFTGLIDKSGQEIYEGDIVKADNGRVGKIFFHEGAFTIAPLDDWLEGDFKVIGNIYEDPGLL